MRRTAKARRINQGKEAAMRRANSMRWKKTDSVRAFLVPAIFGLLVANIALAPAAGQSLAEQLMKRYRVSRVTLTPSGAPATEPGEIYHLRRGGLLAFAEADRGREEICAATFRAGALHVESGALCQSGRHKVLRAADPVCITAISVNEENDAASFYLIECGSRGAIADTYYAKLIFDFPKESLASLSAARMAPVIAEMLTAGKDATEEKPKLTAVEIATLPQEKQSPTKSPAAEKAEDASGKEDSTPEQEPTPSAKAADQKNHTEAATDQTAKTPDGGKEETNTPPKEQTPAQGHGYAMEQPPSVGQTIEQVKALRGLPDVAADLDKRLIWIYPDGMRVIFVEGKVTAVEPPEKHE
jgi:hypothetical protein